MLCEFLHLWPIESAFRTLANALAPPSLHIQPHSSATSTPQTPFYSLDKLSDFLTQKRRWVFSASPTRHYLLAACVPTTATSFFPSSRACELSIPCRCWLGLLLLEVRKSVNDSCDREENVISGMEGVEPILKMLLNTHHLGDSYVIIILYYITFYFCSEMT